MEMVSSTVGSETNTGWKRRARAASFSMCLRYSSSVVAPTQCSSPRASAGFSRLPASIAPSALPAPTMVCSSSMNRMMRAALGLHLGQHGLQPLLELAAVLGAGDQRAHVERQQLLVLEALGHVALDDALGQPFGDGGLADAGLADQHGVVLGAPGQHLDGAADLLVAADHGIDLALGGQRGQVARVALERVVGLLGRGAVGRAALADVVDGLVQRGRVDAGILEHAGGVGLLHGQGQQQALDGDELVAGLVGDLLGGVEHARQLGRQVDLAGPAAGHLGPLRQRELDGLQGVARAGRRRAGSARRPCLPGRRAALSGDGRGRTAGGPRAMPGSARTARNPWRGRCISRSP